MIFKAIFQLLTYLDYMLYNTHIHTYIHTYIYIDRFMFCEFYVILKTLLTLPTLIPDEEKNLT